MVIKNDNITKNTLRKLSQRIARVMGCATPKKHKVAKNGAQTISTGNLFKFVVSIALITVFFAAAIPFTILFALSAAHSIFVEEVDDDDFLHL